MRIAWFSPLPPVRTGVAACSAGLVAALSARGHDLDTYPAEAAHDFPWRHRRQPYDLILYQMGNSSHHDYEWAYALHYPGLVVLHDTHLHHARAAFLLRERRVEDYRAEFRWNHPGVDADAAELAVAGFDSELYYEWPMVRGLVERSRLVAVHGESARRELSDPKSTNPQIPNPTSSDPQVPNPQVPNHNVVAIRLGHGEFVSPERRATARERVRAKYGIAQDAVLFGCFGGITPEKRVPQVLRAFAATTPYAPSARLWLVGAPAAHYDVDADIAALGLGDRAIVTGYIEGDDALTDYLAASDVSMNLRWPTARETSGPWLRALAAGVATVITDLLQLTDVPAFDPRTWTAHHGIGVPAADRQRPVSVAIDILDEDHSLRLAMRRLATDADLRRSLGAAGQEYWQREHTVDAMVEDYQRIILEAASRPDPAVPADAPGHIVDSGDGALRALLRPFALDSPL